MPVPPPKASPARPPGEPRFVVGLVGAGGIAAAHLPAWLTLGVDVLVYSDHGAAELVQRTGGGTVVGSLDELLAGCHAVDVCTPTLNHPEVVLRAAAAGRDVVCEKPLARTTAAAAEMVAACRTAGVQLYPAHVVRWFSEYATLHAAVVAGEVGTVAVQRFSRAGSRPTAAWFHDEAKSGGIVLDQSIHDLDQARWHAGEVSRVFARQTRPAADGVRSVQVLLSHTGGAVSYVTGTWARPGFTFRTTFEVAGTAGLLRHDSREHPPLVVDSGGRDDTGTGLLPATPFAESPYLSELRDCYAAFRGGPPPRVSADDGVAAVSLAEAAIASLTSGAAVELTPAEHAQPATAAGGPAGSRGGGR